VRIPAAAVAFALAFALVVHLRVPQELPPVPGPGELRVVTYNIRAGLDGLDEVVEDLRALSPDVIALQEVERGVARSMRADQPAELGRALGMEHAFVGSIVSPTAGDHGVAILSRYPMSEVMPIPLPQGNGRWPRVALEARIEAPQGPFRMVAVHLARPWGWPLSNTGTRLAQIRTLLDVLGGDELPVVVAGDFNSFAISPEVWAMERRLESSWKPWRDGWAPSFELRSVGWPGGAIKIDHVFHDRRWGDRGTWAATHGASDHRPVVADLVPEPAR